ncbi:MAG: bleomycin resistance protein [Marinirhabdus sp.]
MACVKGIPVLASLHIAKTVRFYGDALGFKTVIYQDESYAVLKRDAVEIHFWKCKNRKIPKNTSCYVHVTEIGALYSELQKTNCIHPNGPLTEQPWGMSEFAVLDGDGNMIKFAQKL